jgi:hypothetical protein
MFGVPCQNRNTKVGALVRLLETGRKTTGKNSQTCNNNTVTGKRTLMMIEHAWQTCDNMIFVTDSYWMAMFGHSRASSFCGDPSVDSSGFGDGDDLDMSEFGDFDVDLTGYDWDVRGGGCLNGCSDPFHELGQVKEYA